ncbi:MAG TPA: FAD-dependent thymidylate synthase [Bacillota bacterium]|nr:FAD-dependent thymidylate synthase [Bacillota bacterium]
MIVELIAHTPDPERLVAVAARLCYSEVGLEGIRARLSREQVTGFISLLRRSGHLSPFEHAVFSFYLEGWSRVTTHQLVRHRIASYSQQSQRYVAANPEEFVVPPSIRSIPAAREEHARALAAAGHSYRRLVDLGVPSEDARYCLPQAVTSRLILTMNARELLHFFEIRTCRRAQWEIRFLALSMLRLVRKAAPAIFRPAGPECLERGRCRQGKLSCGRLKEGAGYPGTD